LGYDLYDKKMLITNPTDISDELEKQFKKSNYCKSIKNFNKQFATVKKKCSDF